MGVINNAIRIAGIEANMAGIMTSISKIPVIETNIAGVMTSVNSMELDLNDLKTIVGDNSSGLVKSVSDLSTSVTGKADKVSGATNGDFAGLDSNGNLTDSGKKPSDYMLTATYDNTAAVAEAGGIVAYINDTVAAALTASY